MDDFNKGQDTSGKPAQDDDFGGKPDFDKQQDQQGGKPDQGQDQGGDFDKADKGDDFGDKPQQQ